VAAVAGAAVSGRCGRAWAALAAACCGLASACALKLLPLALLLAKDPTLVTPGRGWAPGLLVTWS
jgi:hypothetical protein